MFGRAPIDGQADPFEGVVVEEQPECFRRHIGRQVILPAGAPFGMESEDMEVELSAVYPVVKKQEAETKEQQATCVWAYELRRTTDGRGRMVSCVDMLPFLVPKGLVAQKKKMETALLNVRRMNFSLGNRVLKQEQVQWHVQGS